MFLWNSKYYLKEEPNFNRVFLNESQLPKPTPPSPSSVRLYVE